MSGLNPPHPPRTADVRLRPKFPAIDSDRIVGCADLTLAWNVAGVSQDVRWAGSATPESSSFRAGFGARACLGAKVWKLTLRPSCVGMGVILTSHRVCSSARPIEACPPLTEEGTAVYGSVLPSITPLVKIAHNS